MTRDDLTAAIWHAVDTYRVQGPRMAAFVAAVVAASDACTTDSDAVIAGRRAILEAALRKRRVREPGIRGRRPVLTARAEAELAKWDAWRAQAGTP